MISNQDEMFFNQKTKYEFEGIIDDTIRFIEDVQLLDEKLWSELVNQFRKHTDCEDARWRGEFWGKMMRGACLTYSYTRNKALYDVLTKTITEMLSLQEDNGRISSYTTDCEFDGWDIWCRKYVIVGMQYYYEICADDTLKKELISSMCRQMDYIISKVGKSEDGKILITMATRHWRGLNSSSLLEPVMQLYNMTKQKEYLDFAEYIISCGGTSVVNIFELAYENKIHPFQYPITKAYEMISCFEGLLEYCIATENEKYKTTVKNFAERVLNDEFSVIGCCGASHEFFDNTVVRQANTTNNILKQETCVTVTMMRFMRKMFLFTGERKYIDAFEISMYNAFLGSVNRNKNKTATDGNKINPIIFPFDSYSPLTKGTRGVGIAGNLKINETTYYGCCAAIGASGSGIIPKTAVLNGENGEVFINLYIKGKIKSETPSGNSISLLFDTDYPKTGEVNITVLSEKQEELQLCFRNPQFSECSKIYLNGELLEFNKEEYIKIKRVWNNGDCVRILFDMKCEAIYPISYGKQFIMMPIWGQNYMIPVLDEEDENAKKHIAIRRGPIILALDSRLGYDLEKTYSIKVDENGLIDFELSNDCDSTNFTKIIHGNIPLVSGDFVEVADYSSAGKLWGPKSVVSAWIKTEE